HYPMTDFSLAIPVKISRNSEKEMPSLKSILRLCIYISILPIKTPAETVKNFTIFCRNFRFF
ncbi:hypothetical protein, partial [Cytobacillus firmus]|uniref:hypothetical protein n=1 Tax=Cytobacillus firmus TaxID=1399 RepID=UPI002DBAD9AA